MLYPAKADDGIWVTTSRITMVLAKADDVTGWGRALSALRATDCKLRFPLEHPLGV
jgi:hypothetical protein